MGATAVAARCSSWAIARRGQTLAASPRGNYQPSAADRGVQGRDGTKRAAVPGPRSPESASISEAASADPTDAADGAVVAVERLVAGVEEVGALDLSALSDLQLEAHLSRLRRPLAALEAARARAMAEVERRVRRGADPGRVTGQLLESRRRAAKDQRMSPSEAKRAAEAGSHAAANPATGQAFSAGDVGPAQVRLLGDALERLPAERRAEAEKVLLEAARILDPVAFGRKVRRYLAEHAPAQLHRQEQGNHRHRRFRMADTEDGGVAFSGLAYGAAAELARTALDAFRRPDTPDEHRTPEQRSADAFEQLCDAALRLGEAPTVHGERPQVILVVEASELERGRGAARFAGSGQPVTLAEAGTLLTDCEVSRVVRDADGTPIEVTKNVRTVPIGLWRALVVRDGGCRWEGCDAPASWCDVAHGQAPFRAEGRLSPANAMLLCRRHHRRFDKGPWRVEITGDQVTFHREEQEYIHPLDRAHGPPDRDDGAPDRTSGSPEEGLPRVGPPDDGAPRAGPQADVGADPPQVDTGPDGAGRAEPTRAGPSRPGPPRGSTSGAQLGLLDP